MLAFNFFTALASLAAFEQPSIERSIDTKFFKGEDCYRECVPGDTRTCHFNFNVHLYQTLSRACYDCPKNVTDCSRPECITGDGFQRKIMVVNKQMPGPNIQVCEGDLVIVDVKNSLPGGGLAIHWHGLDMKGPSSSSSFPPPPVFPSSSSSSTYKSSSRHSSSHHSSHGHSSKATPFMDGVPGITQCPINPGTSFRYAFYASNAGTHFYHAHTGFQRGDGVFGPITVRQNSGDEPNVDLYDFDLPEHNIMVNDWHHTPVEDIFVMQHYGTGSDDPDTLLVNGQGPLHGPSASEISTAIPYKQFKVTPGKRYRLRLINTATSSCPITFSIEDHILKIISSDGYPVKPVDATSLVLQSGERFDVVVEASSVNRTRNSFWMSFMGDIDCVDSAAHQFGILEYETMMENNNKESNINLDDKTILDKMAPKPAYSEKPPEGVQVNSVNRACYDDRICVADLRSPNPLPTEMKTPRADYTFYLAFNMRGIYNPHYYSKNLYDYDAVSEDQQVDSNQVNNITFAFPSTPPLIGGSKKNDPSFCNAESSTLSQNCKDGFCECTHMYHVPLGSSVDLVLIDEGQGGDESHPYHLHGQSFWVLGMDKPNDVEGASITRREVIAMDKRDELVRNFDHPIYKDTVAIPDGGYTVVRFKADNPGYWLSHCHVLFHSEAGMTVLFKTGEDAQMPRPPKDFPTCGNFENSRYSEERRH